MFEMLAPRCSSIFAMGNAAYTGPADTLPSASASTLPFMPEFSPKFLMTASLGTSTSMTVVSM